ncbi:MAG: hypothetical protein EXR69_11350 [Myxococcales bacterium]|nr:hypothetical protein [Myxococcales bacterium]
MCLRSILTLPAIPVLASLFLGAAACGKSAVDYEKEAQTALDAGDGAKALLSAEEGLKSAGSDKAVAWRLEKVRVEALAKEGKGAGLPTELERLKASYPGQATAQFYKAVADKLATAGDKDGELAVLDAGARGFPEDKTFLDAIEGLKGAANSPEDVERLKALGYL